MKSSSQRFFVSAVCVFGSLLFAPSRSPSQTNTFTTTGSMSTTRNLQTATTLQDGRVLIAGGYQRSSAEVYNPLSGSTSVVNNMHSARWGHTATLLNNGLVLLAGGCTGSGTCLSSAELYNPSTG